MDLSSVEVVDNTTDRQFELALEGDIALIAYRLVADNVYALDHTEVPESFEGKGVGSALVEKTLKLIESCGGKIIPYCPFVRAYLQRHPDWNRLVQ